MTSADLNADGAGDLIVGYASAGGGHLALYQGSLDTLSARTPEIFEGMKEGRFPAPFLPEARLIALPVAPDFVGTGDFNRDGWKDVVAAERGDNRAILLHGNSRGEFDLSYAELPGQVTAMLTDNIDPLDNAADIAFAVDGQTGASLLVYNGATDALSAAPEIYPLSAPATSLAIGQLDDDEPMDILVAGGSTAIIHGVYPDSQSGQTAASRGGQVETLFEGFDVAAARVGNFVWDRENRPEIALLSADGSVRILERGQLDKRPFTEAELKARWGRHRGEAAEREAVRPSDDQPRPSTIARQRWAEADHFQTAALLGANRGPSAAFFTSARMTGLGVEDLLVLDSASRKLHVLVSNDDELKQTGEYFALSASGERAAVTLDVEGATPIAAMPMRLSMLNRPGIVLLDEESGEPSFALAAAAATFTVTKTADTYDGVCNADCSFREALQAANANSDSDIIMLPAGTYTINPALGGPDQDTTVDPAAQQSGDWDVIYDTTIMGAGQATTILQAAAAQPGHDRVLDAIQTGIGIPDLTISGVTIRNGRCQAGCVDGGGLRYAVDALSTLTISDSTFDNNRTEVTSASPANNGGGIFGGTSTSVFTNVTVTNNTAAFVQSGCTGATQCGGEGGGIFAGITNNTNPVSVTMTNCTITGNTANAVNGLGGRGGAYAGSPNSVSITGGTFNNNVAFTDGGALRLFTPTTISGATISNNSARQNGGGIWSDPLANNNTPLTNTFTNLVMKGNTADSDGVIGPNNVNRGDGGAIFHGRGTLNLNNPTIGGTGAGEGNTAFDGGGIARTYSPFTSAIFNASTLNINNGGSIVGNQAINNGGGIINDATKSAAAGNASVLNMTGTTPVTFTNNSARNHGGGIAVITGAGSSGPAASATLNNMTLRNNTANSDSSGGGDGGALYQNSGGVAGGGTTFTGTLTIGGSGFANQAVNGGGIRNNAGAVTIPSGASITHNTATGNGGGISNAGTLSALANAAINHNIAGGNGGGIHNTGTLGAITGSSVNTNSAATGGGIFNSNGALSISGIGAIVSGNAATSGKGGGIEHSGSSGSVTGVEISNNTGSGIHLTGTGSLDVKTSTITGNTGDGITMIGTGTGSNFDSNVIHTNGELGVDLSDNGASPNDPNDADGGPNNLQNFPVINYVRRGDAIANVSLNTANGSYRIQYYANTTCDPSGHGEGEVLLATQTVTVASNNATFFSPALAFGNREQITAVATSDPNNNGNFDDDGSSSEFSACRKVNTLPTFTGMQTPSRQQGSLVSNSQIVTVADPDQALNTLAVTVKAVGAMGAGGATANVNGVTVSNIAVDASGNVTADIIADCTATNASFTLRVTDNATEFNEATLSVTVTANTPPTVGTYPNMTVNVGSSGTVITPDAAPTDNGSIASLTASAPGFTGTFVGNTTTGALTVTNANPPGVYTVTVTATDNCGATATTTFQLTVNDPPTITGATISRQQGSPASTSQIATVNDNNQAEETLTVTVTPATGSGVTVGTPSVDAAGNVTASVQASCAAANSTFTLTVTDEFGASNTATLTVNVTANTAPTLGTYPNTQVTPTGSTTVTPDAAPADNGSIESLTASAPGFTGTLSVNPTTGVITVSNAGPAGVYTVTVTATDNCGTTTTKTFTLTVNNPPTITGATISRQQGSPASDSQIGTASDPDQASNTLTVTATPMGGSGVSVNNILVDASNNVTADVQASCAATNSTFTLTVTDSAGGTATATLTVNITPNTPPTLGTYPNAGTLNPGAGTTVTPDAAPTDNGTIATLTASAPGFAGTFNADTSTGVVTVTNANPPGVYTVTVTATDNCGATATKAFTLNVNAAPTITGATISRQQGSSATNSQIATVGDADQAEETLTVTAAPASGSGVSVNNIVVNAAGSVTADVQASCAATNSTFTLTVTDGNGLSNTATLTVNITPNTPPTLGTYPTTQATTNTQTTVTPNVAPTDNGAVDSLTGSAPGFAGTFSGDTSTGVITINNPGPAGSYTVTVVATDNCGATTTETFTLNVNTQPEITAAGPLSRQQGSPASTSQIATVSDADQAANTLAVTVNGGASATVNGVTVSGIALDSAGSAMASVVASCTAANATFTLTVNDDNGGSKTATLTVNVTPNTPPTLSAYPTTSFNPGGSATVTPSAMPTDNGTIATLTASAPGFAGAFSGNPTTGVVSVLNANPPGVYTVTVTATDNCGATATKTFTLTVSATTTTVVAAVSGQYSDVVTLQATVTPSVAIPDSPLTGNVQFSVGGTPVGTAAVPAGGGTASLPYTLTQAAGSYNITAVFISTNLNYLGSSGGPASLTVKKENTATDYTGDEDIMTAGPSITTATVRLAAHLTPEGPDATPPDNSPGDITLARVRFYLFKGGTIGATPDLVVPAESSPALAVDANGDALTTVNLAADTWTIKVKVDAANQYWKHSNVAIGVLNIAVPTNERRSSGGGWVADQASASGKGHFGFTVALGGGKNPSLKGSSTFVFRGTDGFDYLVKSNSWSGGYLQFAAEPGVSPATYTRSNFRGRCNVLKIDPQTGEAVQSWGNYTFEVFTRDGDLLKPGQADAYSITVWTNNSQIFHRVGSSASLVDLGGGNITNKNK